MVPRALLILGTLPLSYILSHHSHHLYHHHHYHHCHNHYHYFATLGVTPKALDILGKHLLLGYILNRHQHRHHHHLVMLTMVCSSLVIHAKERLLLSYIPNLYFLTFYFDLKSLYVILAGHEPYILLSQPPK